MVLWVRNDYDDGKDRRHTTEEWDLRKMVLGELHKMSGRRLNVLNNKYNVSVVCWLHLLLSSALVNHLYASFVSPSATKRLVQLFFNRLDWKSCRC